MTREKGFQMGKWIGYTVGMIAIIAALANITGKIYAEDARLDAVEAKACIIPENTKMLHVVLIYLKLQDPTLYDRAERLAK